MDFEDSPTTMAVPVSKRGKRTLLGLGLSLFLVSIYWYFPAPSSWWSYDATPKFRDRDWSRFDEVSLLFMMGIVLLLECAAQ